jgi:hypothetical protein
VSSETIPTFEPTEIIAGETLNWTKSLLDYPASEGWTLKYYFRGAGAGFDVTATADGDDFSITVSATATATMAAGVYYWQAEVSLSGEKHIVDSGQATVKASLASVTSSATFDGRSRAQKILDAIDAMLEGKASLDQQEYMIGNRSLKRIPIPDLIALRTHYAQLVGRERRAEKIRQGASFLKTVHVRFRQPR